MQISDYSQFGQVFPLKFGRILGLKTGRRFFRGKDPRSFRHLLNSAANMNVALRERHLDPEVAETPDDLKV